jgi:hypothetical protein
LVLVCLSKVVLLVIKLDHYGVLNLLKQSRQEGNNSPNNTHFVFDRWYSGFVGWSSLIRLRHVTSGLYLAVIGDENGKLMN